MSDSDPAHPWSPTAAVKQALSALASRTDTATRPSVAVIDEADAARSDLRRAAGFVDSGGLDRLDEAIAAAERAGDDEAAAERGREARARPPGSAKRRPTATTGGGDEPEMTGPACDDERGR